MMRRVASIRERDLMFVDTLNEYYVSFYEQMRGSYGDWRKNSYEEQAALDKIARESMLKKILGGAAILAGTVIRPKGQGSDVAQEALILGGMLVLNAGFQKDKEKAMHSAALKELANSFDGDVAPLLVEVEGQQVRSDRLGGNAVHRLARHAAGDVRPRDRAAHRPERGRDHGRAAVALSERLP